MPSTLKPKLTSLFRILPLPVALITLPLGEGVGVADGARVCDGTGDGVDAGAAPQVSVYIVPPRVASDTATPSVVNVSPRSPARTVPYPIAGPCVTKGF